MELRFGFANQPVTLKQETLFHFPQCTIPEADTPRQPPKVLWVKEGNVEHALSLSLLFDSFSFSSFTQLEYQLISDVPNTSSKTTFKCNTNLCSVSREKIIYLVIPHILSANS